MRIGDDDNYLSIECDRDPNLLIVWLEAHASRRNQTFDARTWTVGEWTAETGRALTEFEEQRAASCEVSLKVGGWLRLRRDEGGRIAVRYRITGFLKGPVESALEGEVLVADEESGQFFREFRALFEG